MAALIPMLIGPVSDLLGGILKRLWPEKMSESEKMQLTTALQLELLKYDWSAVEKEYQDRASARDLAAKDVEKGNWFTNVLAATVRPFFGYVVMAAFFASWVTPYIPGAPVLAVTDIQKEIMLSVIYFYFGGRTVEKSMAIWNKKREAGT